MELIYILTYDCNFRCTYCDIDKRKEDISSHVLEDSMLFLKENNFDINKVKFFGWEPLIKKKDIKYIINNFPGKYESSFFITSNSTLIDDGFMNFVEEKNIKLTFSIDWDSKVTWKNRVLRNEGNLAPKIIANTKKYHKNIRVNQVITSNNSKDFFKNFKFIYDLGVRKFNFLPEYYAEWSKQWLMNLKRWFDEINDFYKKWNTFYLVNLENHSDIAFFNVWIIIDTDWKIYGTNLILAGTFEKYKKDLVIGDLKNGLTVDIHDNTFVDNYLSKVKNILWKEYSTKVLKSVYYVDMILNDFCSNSK